MNINRRLLLQIPVILAGPLYAAPGAAVKLLPAPTNEAPDLGGCAATLASYVDTLLPTMGNSPSGSELNIPERILSVAQRRPPYARLMNAGCDWLDEVAKARSGKAFLDVSESDREAIVAAAEAGDRRSLQGQFFFTTHRHAMELFYSHPKSWPALDYPGPPQPVGFLDYAKRPATSA